jgi:ABC-type multidrug transport system permease subunit
MFRGFSSIVYKELLHIRRDRFSLFFIFFIPIFQLLVFGYAIDTNVRHIHTAVFNPDGRDLSRQLIDAFQNTGYFAIVYYARSDGELHELMRSGEAKVGIKIPPDYSDAMLAGEQVSVQVLIDGSDSAVAAQALTSAAALGLNRSLEILRDRNPSLALQTPLEVRPRVLFNPGMRSPNFMLPALIGIILQVITVLLTAFSIVRERERGTLDQLFVTPITSHGVMLGKLLPYWLIASFETAGVVAVMRFLFQVPIHGDLVLLSCVSLVFVCSTSAIGLLISSRSHNQLQALQMAYSVILPSVLLSGFLFSRDTMPAVMYWASYLIPVTYFIEIMRGIVLRGSGWADVWPYTAVLIAICFACLGLSALGFRKSE